MIAQVIFDSIMPKKDYEILKGSFDLGEVSDRVGIKWGSTSGMSEGDYYYDEVVSKKEGDTTKYFHGEKEVTDYHVYKRLSTDSVYLKDENKCKQVVDIDHLYHVTPNVKVKIDKVIPLGTNTSFAHLAKAVETLAQKIDTVSNKQFDFNAKCNVHVPGIGLLRIKTVDYCLDMCTEELQKRLDEGWRIIAACPQGNQRRPDYVLGLMDMDIAD